MGSSSFCPSLDLGFKTSPATITMYRRFRYAPQPQNKFQRIGLRKKPELVRSAKNVHLYSYSPTTKQVLSLKSLVPLAASIAILLWSSPAKAGFLSGFSGIESTHGPQLPQLDFLTPFNGENQKKYTEADTRFKESPLFKQLLERSKLNKEKNRQEILDKY